MRIGIDCKSMSLPYYCGLKTYVCRLVENLAIVDKQNTYVLFSPVTISVPSGGRFAAVSPPTALSWLPWQIVLPILSAVYKTDVFHIPRQNGFFLPFHPRTVTTVHDFINEVNYPGRFGMVFIYVLTVYLSLLRKFTIGHSSALIAVSEYVRNQLRARGVVLRTFTVYSGVSRLFKPRKYAPGSTDSYFLGMTDSSSRKNTYRVLRAYSGLPLSVRRACRLLIIVPSADGARKLMRLCKDLSISDRVDFRFSLSDDQLSDMYGNAIAFVYPSLAEGFGLPVLEAMACGCPVITSGGTATEEIAGGAAILVNPCSVDEIRDAMLLLCDNSRTASEYSRRGIDRAKSFSWELTAKKTLSVYKKISVSGKK